MAFQFSPISTRSDFIGTDVKRLFLSLLTFRTPTVNGDGLSCLTSLTCLDLEENKQITNNDLQFLTGLRVLNLSYVSTGIFFLHHLEDSSYLLSTVSFLWRLFLPSLAPCWLLVDDSGISHLTSLTALHLCRNRGITEKSISLLVNLTDLDLYQSSVEKLSDETRARLLRLLPFDDDWGRGGNET